MNRIWPTPQKKHALLGGLIGMNAYGEVPIRIVSSLVRISGQILLILIPPTPQDLNTHRYFRTSFRK
jgi:hypothetical protein